MGIIRVLQFQSSYELQQFLQGPVPAMPSEEPGLGNDRTKIIQIYFDAASSMHTVIYEAPNFS
jgi:hypothetical protein